MSMGSNTKVAVVTGGGTGIGKAVALALAGEGYSVVVAGRRKEPLEATARDGSKMGARMLSGPTDVGDPGCVRALFAQSAATEMTQGMVKGVRQANGDIAVEPRIELENVTRALVYMASLPLDANVQFMTVMATKMPFIGRG